jgi:hypothetical protein
MAAQGHDSGSQSSSGGPSQQNLLSKVMPRVMQRLGSTLASARVAPWDASERSSAQPVDQVQVTLEQQAEKEEVRSQLQQAWPSNRQQQFFCRFPHFFDGFLSLSVCAHCRPSDRQ